MNAKAIAVEVAQSGQDSVDGVADCYPVLTQNHRSDQGIINSWNHLRELRPILNQPLRESVVTIVEIRMPPEIKQGTVFFFRECKHPDRKV